ncbi:hypothetical protein H9P43_001782 [Blastocladiella emersonii ATCC 22665]|nr:hypothetical protein H9P43_001782 [Blastocladiella emersonii ATCC 22665]
MDLLALDPPALVDHLLAHGVYAAAVTFVPTRLAATVAYPAPAGLPASFVVRATDHGTYYATHAVVAPLIDWLIEDEKAGGDADGHEAVVIAVGRESRTLMGAVIHNTTRGAAAGGVRNCIYASVEEMLRDGLRLGRGMSQKNALAGILHGGGKGVMARNSGTGLLPTASPAARRVVFEEYGEFMTQLQGSYVTAEDVGTRALDMVHLYSRTRFTTCIPRSLGGSGEPSGPTARGVLRGLEASFAFLAEQEGVAPGDASQAAGKLKLREATVAVQGFGHVGKNLVRDLVHLAGVKRVVVTDPNPHNVDGVDRTVYPADRVEIRLANRGDHAILALPEADAVCPCATGGGLNETTVPLIKAKVVCGAANNQLQDIKHTAPLLAQRGIVYVPDFLVNRMGIVACADEAAGYVRPSDPAHERHLGYDWDQGVFHTTLRVLRAAKQSGMTTQEIALAEARAKLADPHPIFGHRGISAGAPSPTSDPASGTSTSGAADAAAAAVKEAETELLELIRQKQKIDKSVMEIEYRIYQLEGSYLEETAVGGNILRGFDGYLGARSERRRTRGPADNSDRIFSNSSTTYQDSLRRLQELRDGVGVAVAHGASTHGELPPAVLAARAAAAGGSGAASPSGGGASSHRKKQAVAAAGGGGIAAVPTSSAGAAPGTPGVGAAASSSSNKKRSHKRSRTILDEDGE